LNLPIDQALKLIVKATEEHEKEKIFRLYLVDRPRMDKQTFMSFSEYYDKLSVKQTKVDTRSKEEILKELGIIQERE